VTPASPGGLRTGLRAALATAIGALLVATACGPGGASGTSAPTLGSAATTVPTILAPTSSPVALSTPINIAGWKAFTSAWHGYDIRYPPDWTLSPATREWSYGQPGDEPHDGTADEWRSGVDFMLITSQVLPVGMSEIAWITQYEAPAIQIRGPACFPPAADWAPTTVDGHPGRLHGGNGDCWFVESVVVVERRAYVLTGSYAGATAKADLERFDAFLSTVHLHPRDAPIPSR
jgi:hypothetical protein